MQKLDQLRIKIAITKKLDTHHDIPHGRYHLESSRVNDLLHFKPKGSDDVLYHIELDDDYLLNFDLGKPMDIIVSHKGMFLISNTLDTTTQEPCQTNET